MKILIINGPNLNMLGTREVDIYGEKSFDGYLPILQNLFKDLNIEYFQSNWEGEIIDKLQEADKDFAGVVLNAAAFTHTSVAIADAVKAISIPVVEVHISNILNREDFRHKSLVGPNCLGSIMGFGLDSYRLGIESLRVYREK